MKKRNGLIPALMMFVITVSLYVVFNSRIESQPNHVGFWFIFVVGMATGVLLTQLIQHFRGKKEE